ncbi:hypothetical protein niasHT_013602 [Heterodera trifolii]|uniref:Thioredoxin-related transmembrane protein 1 n=1 Tax=Heterodera trifolii TaxID=157864 RepID=A0ABD2LE46_9BILA
MADQLGNHGYVSPCNMLTALVYIMRLKESNERDFLAFNPTELFVSSLVLATKYLNDGTLQEFIWNDEWASVSGLALTKLNELEIRLLTSLRWDVSIQSEDFENVLARLEGFVASEMAQQNGIMSYNELCILSNTHGFNRSILCLLIVLLKFLFVLLAFHLALLAGLSVLNMAVSRKQELAESDACIYHHGWDDCSHPPILLANERKIDANLTKVVHKDAFFAFVHAFSIIKSKNLLNLNEENWRNILSGEWMMEFHAPWCPACKDLQKSWNSFADWSRDLNINVAEIDVTTNPGLSGRFLVTALPTIYHVKDGVFRLYAGPRDKNDFISFIEDKRWTSIDPLPSYKHPDSSQMGVVAVFFKLSMAVRDLHGHFVENVGIPAWASYAFFATVTLALGCVLGFIIVCIIDYVFPTGALKKKEAERRKEQQSAKKNAKESAEKANGQKEVLSDEKKSPSVKKADSKKTK